MRIPIIVTAILLAGCSSTPGAPTGDEPAHDDGSAPARPPGTPARTLVAATDGPIRDEGELTGVLGADSVEGGCAYLETADRTRYEVLYPRGWRVTVSPLQLTDPDGVVVARGGDEVTVLGAETREVATICQIGPIFQATSVER